jgi:2-amino-4-hydroxy-6-hydroxymethyldihydropteridine diphosphokinase
MTEGIFILLGSNLGDRKSNLSNAIANIQNSIGETVKTSSIYETAAWGKTNQPSFYNQVIQLKTNLPPTELLIKAHSIEEKMGRIRKVKWGERLIDIDLLYYNDQVIISSELQVPHSGIPYRRFTLIPLVEIAPDFIHPALMKSNSILLEECQDFLKVGII